MINFKSFLSVFFTAALASLVAAPSHAHHSDVGINMGSMETINGVVTEFNWRNPHVYLLVEVMDEQGVAVEWEIQMGSVSVSQRRGWSSDYVAPGDRVTIEANTRLNGEPYGILDSLEKDDGDTLGVTLDKPDGTAVAESVAGQWIADVSSFPDYPGGYDGFFIALLSLNDNARQAAADFDPLSAENPNSSCAGRPTPGGFVSSNLYMIEIEVREDEDLIIIRSERDAEERMVYMDGRSHPSSDQLVATGHSIGWWEEGSLIVDTTNFPFHRSPYQTGVPSSTNKHVVERYWLNDTGTRLEAEFMLEDPVYLTGPMTHSRSLMYSPDTEMFLSKCDPESASRFLSR
jgi:hypothetical protein|tara:strand:- start:9 stop:1046 length:1038 start_codon:yes stop_codon:yes gene_type:complete